MFTDIVGSTALRDAIVGAHGEGEGDRRYREQILTPHNERIQALLETHRGFEVKTNGDSFMVAFANAEDAVVCAAAIQRSLRDAPIATSDAGKPLAVRIGVHTGSPVLVERDGKPDYDGHAVNIAARVEGLLKDGERIYCSGATAALAKTPPAIHFHSYGSYALKGVSGKVEVVEALWDAAIKPAPPEQQESLPYPWLTQWVGREREMTTLAESIKTHRLVTLHGTGGVGKTRMAVETLLAHGGGLPRDVVFVSLEKAADSESGVLGAVRDGLGLTETDAPDVSALCRRLQGSDLLLILDNFESVMRDKGLASTFATTPGVRVLVTSQQVLDLSGEHVVKVEPMATTGNLATLESYRLFTGLAQQRDANWQPDDDGAMRDVLEATDGLPYLIELVAAVAPKRKLRHLADELKEHLREVRTKDPSRKESHTSVDACLDWAFARLPVEARSAMPRLAIFAGGFDREAAEEIAETPLATLDVLVDASLLRFDRESGRYSMLSTTRQYALAIIGTDDTARLTALHAHWFIERLNRADDALRGKGGEAQRRAQWWIDAELENVRQATAWAEEKDAALFRVAVRALSMYLTQTGRFLENVRLQEKELRRLDPKSDAGSWVIAQIYLGIAYANLPTGDRGENVAKAIACYETALRFRTEHDFPAEWAATQNNLGLAYDALPTGDRGENSAKAIACFEAALRVYNERDSPANWAATQNNLGLAYTSLPTGDRDENIVKRIACYEAALRVYNERDYPPDWAMTQNNLGNAYGDLATGDRGENIAKAIACYEAALRVWTERDFPLDWAMTQNNLGVTYRDLPFGDAGENLAKGIACFEAALRVRTERDLPLDWARTQMNLGFACSILPSGDRGENVAKAIACYEAAARGFSAAGLTEKAAEAKRYAEALAAEQS